MDGKLQTVLTPLGRKPRPAKVLAKSKRNKYVLRNIRRYV